jgi:AcrR family transcriptional regulator
MTQRSFFTREVVVDTAFELTREKGWSGVSARSIARRLGSSTMPIYSSLGSMEEIEGEVRKRAEALLQEYQLRPFPDNPPLGLAVGYVKFAKEETRLFRFLFLEAPRRRSAQDLEHQTDEADAAFGGHPSLQTLMDQMPELRTNPMILKSWIFVHGLATLVSSGALDIPEERAWELLSDAGEAFYTQESSRKEATSG